MLLIKSMTQHFKNLTLSKEEITTITKTDCGGYATAVPTSASARNHWPFRY